MRVAVYDLGSSSFHLMVVDVDPDGSIVPVLRRRSLLQLGSAVGRSGYLPPDRVAAVVRTIRRLRAAADELDVDVVVALATAALREAANGPDVIRRIERMLGSPVRLLDGDEEARLCFVGQRSGLFFGAGPVLGLDLGGGSFEAAVGDGDRVLATTSVSLGANRLSAELEVSDPLSSSHREAVVEQVIGRIDPVAALLHLVPQADRSVAVISGGTARALVRLLPRHHGANHPAFRASVEVVSSDVLTAEVLAQLADRLASVDLEQRLLMPGMRARRAPTLPVGALILATAVQQLGLERLVVSERGLREGAVLDVLAERRSLTQEVVDAQEAGDVAVEPLARPLPGVISPGATPAHAASAAHSLGGVIALFP